MNSGKLILLSLLSLLVKDSESLKCYRCISLSCPDSPTFCDMVKGFLLQQLSDVYYFYGNSGVPLCPDPIGIDAATAWNHLKSKSSYECGEESSGDATCVLGRFQVTTQVTDTMKNVTSYGTALGCAKRKLLEFTRSAIKRSECSLVQGRSATKNSLRHFLDIEHCSEISDMCLNEDFCISPNNSIVKPFRVGKSEKTGYNLKLFFGIFALIGVCVGVLFVLGIKYDVESMSAKRTVTDIE